MNGAVFVQRETFEYKIPGHRTLIWDVTAAKSQVAAGFVVTRVEIERDQMQVIVDRNEWAEAKVAVADPTRAGIGVPFRWDGKIIYLLIDGTHRCVRALRDGVPFFSDLLTDEAARACLIAGPRELIP